MTTHSTVDAFIYGLADPTVEDEVQALRYIGQTMRGLDRPKAHTQAKVLATEGNVHKANWIKKLKKLGKTPDILVLERVATSPTDDDRTVKQALDEAEIRLIAYFKDLGSPLLNATDGGTNGYTLTEESKRKISQANGWRPKRGTVEENPLTVLTGQWTREKAWWLGVTFARVRVNTTSGRRNVAIHTNSLEIAEKWRDLSGSKHTPIRYRGADWEASIGDVRLVKWLADTYRLHEKWDTGVDWPSDLPNVFVSDFIRGLWDVKGHIEVKPRLNRQPTARTSAESKSWSKAFVQAIVDLTDGAKIYVSGLANGVGVRGAAMFPWLRSLYENAPEAAKCSSQHQRALDAIASWERLLAVCRICGGDAAVGRNVCHPCARRKWTDAVCPCGGSPVLAKGLCRTCYHRAWRGTSTSDGVVLFDWDDATQDSLAKIDPATWPLLDPEAQQALVDRVFKLFRTRKFPWHLYRDRHPSSQVLQSVRTGAIQVEGSDLRNVSSAGQGFCTTFFHHRFKASYDQHLSVYDGYSDDKVLRRAIQFQLAHGDPVTPKRVLRAISANLRGPTNFSPTVARYIVDQFVPQGGSVFDPCAGYGGRLLGTVSSYKNARYIGRDVEHQTVESNRAMAEYLQVADRVEVSETAVEDPGSWPKVDLLLTCPPYFDRENYGAQSQARIPPTFDAWSESFLRPLVTRGLDCSRTVVICSSAIKNGRETFDIPQKIREFVVAAGGEIVTELRWHTASFGKGERHEPIIVARRSS